MQEIISTDKWLRMLANELESKGFPSAYGPQLRHAAEILGAVDGQLFNLDSANMQLRQQLADKEREYAELRTDAHILWSRYQKAIDIIKPYEPKVASSMAEYKPRFYEIL